MVVYIVLLPINLYFTVMLFPFINMYFVVVRIVWGTLFISSLHAINLLKGQNLSGVSCFAAYNFVFLVIAGMLFPLLSLFFWLVKDIPWKCSKVKRAQKIYYGCYVICNCHVTTKRELRDASVLNANWFPFSLENSSDPFYPDDPP